MKATTSRGHGRTVYFGVGSALLGILILHPITMVIYWFEFQRDLAESWTGLWSFVTERMWLSFTPGMLPMSVVFAALGGGAGLLLAAFQRALSVRDRAARNLREELVRDLPLVIAGGETEKIEFKRSLRWDHGMKSVNRDLETVATKTIAGFLNANGGSLILGVDDQGGIKGLRHDFETLKRPDPDGFQQYVMGVIKKRLGGDLCPLIHLAFTKVEQRDVCRVVIEPSHRPVYLEEAGSAKLYLRMGNSTRQLDAKEAVDYVGRHWRLGSTRPLLPAWLRGQRERR